VKLPKDFSDILNDLKILKNAEEEAKKIVETADFEAEKTIRDAEEQAASVVSEIETEVRKAARDLREEADVNITSEVENLEKEFVQDVKEMKDRASEKMDEAVSYVINRVLEIEVQKRVS
jgi:vacuolar-type H+-ATPase subunit H